MCSFTVGDWEYYLYFIWQRKSGSEVSRFFFVNAKQMGNHLAVQGVLFGFLK